MRGDEQRADRNRRQRRIDDEAEAGRNQVGERRRRRGQRRAEGPVVAALRHLRDHQLGDGRGVGRRRARNAGQHGVGHHIGLTQPAAQMADKLDREIDQPRRNAAGIHHRRRENEERDGEQRERIRATPPCSAKW